MADLEELTRLMRQFSEERDWTQFHDPKSLLLALVGEVGELSELFQWLPSNDAAAFASQSPLKERVAEEAADVLLYLIRLADVLGINLTEAAIDKLAAAGLRFDKDAYFGIAPAKE